MTTPNANPNDTFWLARYAHTTLAPIIDTAPHREQLSLKVALHFGGDNPGVDVAVLRRDPQGNHSTIKSAWFADKAKIDTLAIVLPDLLAVTA